MKVLLINAVCGTGSTGRIVADIWKALKDQGHEAKVAYGVGHGSIVSPEDQICFNNKIGYYTHNILAKITDKTGMYLYQDGARENREDDIESVKACRAAVSDIDWNCEVHRLYQSRNYGCDPSEFIAQKWMFSYEEMGIILEDDDVPAQALFPFFRELLIKYKDDNRVAIICGMNNYDIEKEVKESYFFSKRGSIWGWASWRRFIDLWDNATVSDGADIPDCTAVH